MSEPNELPAWMRLTARRSRRFRRYVLRLYRKSLVKMSQQARADLENSLRSVAAPPVIQASIEVRLMRFDAAAKESEERMVEALERKLVSAGA